MVNEELKTFINKMRAAGKSDPEITAELKTAGWEEGAINQELSSNTSKTRFNLGKMKFWIWLYGIAILLFLITLLVGFLFGSTFLGESVALIILVIFMTYTFSIVPIATLLAIGLNLLFWVLKHIAPSKNWSFGREINYWWTFVVSSFISGAIMFLIWYIEAKKPDANVGEGGLIMGIFAVLGGALIIFALILALASIIVKIISKRKKKLSNRL